MKVETELEELLQQNIVAVRVGNALSLGQNMNLNMSDPMDAAKALRYLSTLEKQVGGSDG